MNEVPARCILQGFYSTVVINIITWNKAYSLFPLLTFVNHKGYMLKSMDDFYFARVAKYGRRGWKIEEIMWPEDARSNHPIRRFRRLGDSFSWVIPFDNTKVKCPSTPDYVLDLASFEIGGTGQTYPRLDSSVSGDVEHSSSRYYTICAPVFVSKILKYKYLFGDPSQCDFIGQRVDRLTLLELRKLDPAARPREYDGLLQMPYRLHQELERFEPPDTWSYYDDDYPKWHQAWEKAKAEKMESERSNAETK